METKSWKDIKDNVYGVKGTDRRDELERDFEGFKIGLQLDEMEDKLDVSYFYFQKNLKSSNL